MRLEDLHDLRIMLLLAFGGYRTVEAFAKKGRR